MLQGKTKKSTLDLAAKRAVYVIAKNYIVNSKWLNRKWGYHSSSQMLL